MFRTFMLIASLFLLNLSWPFIDKQLEKTEYAKSINQIQADLQALKKDPEVASTFETFLNQIQHLLKQLNSQLDKTKTQQQDSTSQPKEKAELQAPSKQLFSIYNIELGDKKDDIIHNLGTPERSSLNEYGLQWNAYHNNYHEFFMVMYDKNNQVAGLYTNQDLITSTNGIKIGSPKEVVRQQLGDPLTQINKGLVIYQLQEDSDYDIFLVDNVYITVFYDKHEKNTVTALQLIDKKLEEKKNEIYTDATPALKEGFEYQLFDLTNAVRVNHQLPILTWDDHVRETAREHSSDMADNNYFDHTNLKGESPFDRMKEDKITFVQAGENLAYGQLSSIFAHEGLMNSEGHRKNILHDGYEYLGVGVAFNDKEQPYYTENFYAK